MKVIIFNDKDNFQGALKIMFANEKGVVNSGMESESGKYLNNNLFDWIWESKKLRNQKNLKCLKKLLRD